MKLKLYKFRSLGDCISAMRTKEIIDTGKFWCSPLWEQNDSMEGVYSYWKTTEGIFSEKNNYRICSFSGRRALKDPKMWGYYANGFKGLAIEIEVELPSSELFPISYCDTLTIANDSSPDTVKKIITSKLKHWKSEKEYRFIRKGKSGYAEIGTITGVYFGDPYRCVKNIDQIVENSPKIQKYLNIRDELIRTAVTKEYPCFDVSIRKLKDNWRVTCESSMKSIK